MTRFILLAFGLMITPTVSFGQIYYTTLNQNQTSRIDRINANLTGQSVAPLTASQPDDGKWSSDATTLAFTSTDGNSAISRNIYLWDTTTGRTDQLTELVSGFNSITQTGETHYPKYKAFSPDTNQLAYIDIVQTTTNFGSSRRADLRLVDVGTGEDTLLTVINGRDSSHMGGEGIDWSPKNSKIVLPQLLPSQVSGQPLPVTALVLGDTAKDDSSILTRPTSGTRVMSFPFFETRQFTEHDYHPTFSPSGNEIAYFRVLDQTVTGDQVPIPQKVPAEASLRIIGVNGSNDREILNFAPGQFPWGLTWSPDGTQLALGLGSQSRPTELLALAPNLADQDIHVVNANGTAPRLFLNGPATLPAWRPFATSVASNGDFNGNGVFDLGDLNPTNGLFSVGDLTKSNPAAGRTKFDLTNDGTIDSKDLSLWLSQAASSKGFASAFLPGDTDLDGEVAFSDFLNLAKDFQKGRTWAQGNFDGSADGTQFADFLSLAGNFGIGVRSAAHSVPEPSGVWMLLAGLLAVTVQRRRRTAA